MDAIPPRLDGPAEVRPADDTCKERLQAAAQDQHDAHHDHEHLPEVVETSPPPEDLPPGRQMLDVPQRAWREQAEAQWRNAAQTVQRMNWSASTE
jgi:hypothetical protein